MKWSRVRIILSVVAIMLVVGGGFFWWAVQRRKAYWRRTYQETVGRREEALRQLEEARQLSVTYPKGIRVGQPKAEVLALLHELGANDFSEGMQTEGPPPKQWMWSIPGHATTLALIWTQDGRLASVDYWDERKLRAAYHHAQEYWHLRGVVFKDGGQVALDDAVSSEYRRHFGEVVTLYGPVQHHKEGPYVLGVGILETKDMPENGVLVAVTGKLAEVADLPVIHASKDSEGNLIQGIPVPADVDLYEAAKRIVLTEATWKQVETAE